MFRNYQQLAVPPPSRQSAAASMFLDKGNVDGFASDKTALSLLTRRFFFGGDRNTTYVTVKDSPSTLPCPLIANTRLNFSVRPCLTPLSCTSVSFLFLCLVVMTTDGWLSSPISESWLAAGQRDAISHRNIHDRNRASTLRASTLKARPGQRHRRISNPFN